LTFYCLMSFFEIIICFKNIHLLSNFLGARLTALIGRIPIILKMYFFYLNFTKNSILVKEYEFFLIFGMMTDFVN